MDNILDLWSNNFRHLLGEQGAPPPNWRDSLGNNWGVGDNFVNFSEWEVKHAISSLAAGKAAGIDNIYLEHLRLIGPLAMTWMTSFINACIIHCYLPDELISTVLSPVVKNKAGDLSSSENYRGIAVATSLSKVIEKLIINRIEPFLLSQDSQFGFKAGCSTSTATFVYKETVRHYLNNGSKVYSASLDLSKAFDKVNFHTLFIKLANRGAPAHIVNFIAFWYLNQSSVVKWDGHVSEPFGITNGVRQGGLLSPGLFKLYIDDLLVELSSIPVGCYIGGTNINCIAYADDLIILAPSRFGLQRLLDVCSEWASNNNMSFNIKKSLFIVYGISADSNVHDVFLSGICLKRVFSFTYLGHSLSSTLSDDNDIVRCQRSLLRSFNSLYTRFKSVPVKVFSKIFSACCCPYGDVIWFCFNPAVLKALGTTYHNCIKKFLGVPRTSMSHASCIVAELFPFEALLGMRFINWYQAIQGSANKLVDAVLQSSTGHHGLLQQKYGDTLDSLLLMDYDVSMFTRSELKNYVKYYSRNYYEII